MTPAQVDSPGWGNAAEAADPGHPLAYDLEVVRWEDKDGDPQEGSPSQIGVSISDVYGQLVHAIDEDTGEQHYFWAYVYEPFEEWTEWLYYIFALIEGGTGMGGGGMEIGA